jgi:DNA-binding LacI/PurR family transcriptional regulator
VVDHQIVWDYGNQLTQSFGITRGMSLARIAHSLSISITTVSRALAGSMTGRRRRAGVLAEAARVDYRPSQTAWRRRGRSDAIGVVLPAAPGRFDAPFFLRMLAAIGPHLDRAGLDLAVATYTDPPPTTLEQPIERTAAPMVELLLHLMAGADPAGMHEIWPARLIARASDGPVNEALRAAANVGLPNNQSLGGRYDGTESPVP